MAEARYQSLNGAAREDYSWDNKKMGAQILLYEVTGKEIYKNTVRTNVNEMISSGPYTPGWYYLFLPLATLLDDN